MQQPRSPNNERPCSRGAATWPWLTDIFRIKICGVTRLSDARFAILRDADAIGLNFYPKSKRRISLAQAARIVRECGGLAHMVGVFVDADPSEILQIAERLPLSAVQLHGHEPPEVLAQLRGLRVIRAMRATAAQWDEVMRYLDRCEQLDAMPWAVLLDAAVPKELGGTGQPADWDLAGAFAETPGLPPLVLAGGLNPKNVAKAIQIVRPAGVDVASGVEYKPGRKCAFKMQHFLEAAIDAFKQIGAWQPEV
jgi:phosphoribosylanthranilate isomerase